MIFASKQKRISNFLKTILCEARIWPARKPDWPERWPSSWADWAGCCCWLFFRKLASKLWGFSKLHHNDADLEIRWYGNQWYGSWNPLSVDLEIHWCGSGKLLMWIQNSTDAALDPNPERKVVIGSFSGNLFIFTFVETISIPVLMKIIK